MPPSSSKLWTTDPEYINLLNFIIEKTEHVESPMSIQQMAREFKEKSGATKTMACFQSRIATVRTRIHNFGNIDNNTKVKVLFALSAPVDAKFLKELKKDAVVEVDEKKRITHYQATDGSLELNGDHSPSAKQKAAQLGIESKRSIRSMINSYFENKNDANAVPKNKEEGEMWNLIEFITEKCEHVKSLIGIYRLANDFNKKFGESQSLDCIYVRLRKYCRLIQNIGFLDTHSKVKQLFGLSAKLDSDYLKKLRTEALVEIDEKNRITHYKANDGSLELRGDHSRSARNSIAMDESKLSHRSLIIEYFENKSNACAVPKSEKEKEIGNLIEFITEKCENVHSPLNIRQLARDFIQHSGVVRDSGTIGYRIRKYCCEIQKAKCLDTRTKVEQLFGLSVKLDADYLKELRKNAVVEVDHKNRITKYTANDGSLTLRGNHWGSGETNVRNVEKKDKKNGTATADESDEEESDNEIFNDSSDEYFSEEFDSEFDSDEENDPLDETEDLMETSNTVNDLNNKTPVRSRSGLSFDNNLDFDPPTEISHRSELIETREDEKKENDPGIIGNAGIKTRYGRLSKRRYSDSDDKNKNDDLDKKNAMEPSNEANDCDNETPVRNHSSTNMSIDDNFNFDPPTERSHRSEETEMREDEENNSGIIKTLPKSKTTSSTSHTPKTSKRKAIPSESNSTKRTKPPLEKSINPGEMDDNISDDDPSRVELKPSRGILGHPEGIEDDSDIQQSQKPHPQVMEVPIKKEYEEEAQTSLKMIINAFKSLVLSLDTPGLSKFQMEIDTKIMEAGRRNEISNKEVILAMEFLILKLFKHGSPEYSENSISLRDILLMLRTIILNSCFNGLEVILEMLKEHIEQLKFLDKKVPVTKVECVLRATIDNIIT